MNGEVPAHGLRGLVVINTVIFGFFAFSFFKPRTRRDWRSYSDLSRFEPEDSRVIASCPPCTPDAPRPPGAIKPFCMNCGRDIMQY